jgi:hypothetical protein
MNSWIVQAKPSQFLIDWYLDDYIKTHPKEKDWWLVEKRHQNCILPGDCVYVWKAKSEPPFKVAKDYFSWLKSIGRKRHETGIFAIGEVITIPKQWPADDWNNERFQKYRIGHPWDKLTPKVYWISCTYKDNRARNPLLQETIWEKLGQSTKTDLGHFKVVRTRRLVKLESWEAAIINSLLASSKPQ